MIGLDTNILARYFLQDDAAQCLKADQIIDSLTSEEPGWVGVATILELVWVLSRQNRIHRHDILTVLNLLSTRTEIMIENQNIVQSAVSLYRSGRVDFADCLISASAKAAGCSKTMTFDRRAARDAGMQLVE